MNNLCSDLEAEIRLRLDGNLNSDYLNFKHIEYDSPCVKLQANLEITFDTEKSIVGGSAPNGLPVTNEFDAVSQLSALVESRIESKDFISSLNGILQSDPWFVLAKTNGQSILEYIPERRSVIQNCSSCFGKGENICNSCSGSGDRTCSGCYGSRSQKKTTQVRDSNSNLVRTETTTQPCSLCGGNGKIPCNTCGSRGVVTCNSCTGSGKETANYTARVILKYHVTFRVPADAPNFSTKLIKESYFLVAARRGFIPKFKEFLSNQATYSAIIPVASLEAHIADRIYTVYGLGSPITIEMTEAILDDIFEPILKALEMLDKDDGPALYQTLMSTNIGENVLKTAARNEKALNITKYEPLLTRKMAGLLLDQAFHSYKSIGNGIRRQVWMLFLILTPVLAIVLTRSYFPNYVEEILDSSIGLFPRFLIWSLPYICFWSGALLLSIYLQQRKRRRSLGEGFRLSIQFGAGPWISLVIGIFLFSAFFIGLTPIDSNKPLTIAHIRIEIEKKHPLLQHAFKSSNKILDEAIKYAETYCSQL